MTIGFIEVGQIKSNERLFSSQCNMEPFEVKNMTPFEQGI
jgi:hypothetical protein